MTLARYVRLVVCFHCQKICPENKDFLQWIERKEDFFEEETALLLQGVDLDQLLAATVRKLKKLDLIGYQVFLATWSFFRK